MYKNIHFTADQLLTMVLIQAKTRQTCTNANGPPTRQIISNGLRRISIVRCVDSKRKQAHYEVRDTPINPFIRNK